MGLGLVSLLVTLSIGASLAVPVWAKEGDGRGRTVSGVVLDERGNPLQVELAIDGDPPVFKWSSDGAGRFRIVNVPPTAKDLIYRGKRIDTGSYDLPMGQEEMRVVIYRHPGISVTLVDARGHRMRGIRVVAKRVDSPEPAQEIYDPIVGGSGAIGLPPGKYLFSAPEHPDVMRQTIEIVAAQPVRLTLRQRAGATLRVRVMDRDGLRLDDRAVLVHGNISYPARDKSLESLAPFSPESVEKRRGVTFGGLDPGTYTVLVPVPDCERNASTAHPVSVSGEGSAMTIRLPFSYRECP
jgi:hypothetical protein